MKKIMAIFVAAALGAAATSCIEDGFTSSPSCQPVPSCDTLKMGTLYTGEGSATHRLTLRNPNGKGLAIEDISLSGDMAKYFRLNVDGLSGSRFSNVEIRANDSIYVFVEATLPENDSDSPVGVTSLLDITCNGVRRSIVITADALDVTTLDNAVISADTRIDSRRPVRVKGPLTVAEGATLTLAPGTLMLFHDKASLDVKGRLVSDGTSENPVTLTGDRIDNVVGDIPFDLMSRQWEGVFIDGEGRHSLSHTVIKNTWYGVCLYRGTLEMVNCVLRNSGQTVLQASAGTRVEAVGCELAEGAWGVVLLAGGDHYFNHCTLANYYLFSAIRGPLFAEDWTSEGSEKAKAELTNCILYGLAGGELWQGSLDDTEVYLRRCLLGSSGSDDGHFLNCLWGQDPLYRTVREDYVFDYRLKPDSPAAGAADPSLADPRAAFDRYGLPRGSSPDLGAYVFVPEEE